MAILGDMFEIGKQSLAEHSQIAKQAEDIMLDSLILIGDNFLKVKTNNTKTKQFSSFESFKNKFDFSQIKNTVILIKASRGMALERVLEL